MNKQKRVNEIGTSHEKQETHKNERNKLSNVSVQYLYGTYVTVLTTVMKVSTTIKNAWYKT